MHEVRLREVVTILHEAGIEVLVSKGWSIARLYPQAGLRPYGDLDLHVSQTVLATP